MEDEKDGDNKETKVSDYMLCRHGVVRDDKHYLLGTLDVLGVDCERGGACRWGEISVFSAKGLHRYYESYIFTEISILG